MYCENCGSEISEVQKFCPSCGAKIFNENNSKASTANQIEKFTITKEARKRCYVRCILCGLLIFITLICSVCLMVSKNENDMKMGIFYAIAGIFCGAWLIGYFLAPIYRYICVSFDKIVLNIGLITAPKNMEFFNNEILNCYLDNGQIVLETTKTPGPIKLKQIENAQECVNLICGQIKQH